MSSLHVLYRNGKNSIQVLPSNTLLEILQKGCASFKLDANNFQLNYNDKPVNLSLPFRLSGIPNLSRVTIVEKSAAVAVKSVNLALQFSTGQRAQITGVKTSSTLWDILKQFEEKLKLSITAQFNENEQYLCPVLNILNIEVNTIEGLQQNTLSKLHVTESVLLKLAFKTSDLTKQQAIDLITSYTPPVETPTTSPSTKTISPITTTTTTTITTTTIIAPNVIPTPITSTSPPTTNTNITPITSPTTLPPTINNPTPITSTSPTTSTDATPIVATSTTEINNLTTPMDTSTTETINSSSNDTNGNDLLANKVMNLVNDFTANNPPPKKVNFNLPTSNNSTPDNNNNDSFFSPTAPLIFKYGSPSTPSNVETPKIKEEVKLDDKDRNLKVYVPIEQDLNLSTVQHSEQLTEDDMKRLHESNRREKRAKEEESSILRTKDMREKDIIKKMSKYSKTNIRIFFPSKQVLEMTFLSKEKIANLIRYLKSLFKEPQPLFFLYTTPPYSILSDFNSTFLKENLIPNAKIYIGIKEGSGKLEFTDEVTEMLIQANQVPTLTGSSIFETFKTNIPTTTTTTTTTSTDSEMKEDTETYKETTNIILNEEDTQLEPRKQPNEKTVPKWFLAGNKKK